MEENYNMNKAEEFLKECLKYENFIEGITSEIKSKCVILSFDKNKIII